MPTPSKGIHREWDAGEDERLTSLRKMGLTAAQISEHMPHRSRNAVLGRLDRLGLTSNGVPRKERELHQSARAKANQLRRHAELQAIRREAKKAGVGVVTRVGRREGVDDEWARLEILAQAEQRRSEFKGYDPARDPKPDWLKFSFQREQRKAA